MRGACLRGANLAGADLSGCDLREGVTATQDSVEGFKILHHRARRGELDRAVTRGARLDGAQLGDAFARVADLTDADLAGVSLTGAS
jgi:uncharacterized protein YjbI with pentapeptide repeats